MNTETYKMEVDCGERIADAAYRALRLSKGRDQIVEFTFNGITCLVNSLSVIDSLVRYYMDAHIMDWKTIGPHYDFEYDLDTKIELHTRRLAQAKQQKIAAEEYARKDKAERETAEAKIQGVVLLIHPDKQKDYEEYVAKNSNDGYSRAVIEYGDTWAKLMQIEISKGRTAIKDIADECQQGLGYLGITGFQYGCVVKGLAYFWIFGEELRKWHNKEYGVSEDKKGVVNPAVLTIS